jgi:hypothetical protein
MELAQGYGLMMKKRARLPIHAFALVALFLVSGVSYGFKQEDLDKLSATGQCPFCDLSHTDLPAADLSGADISRADLSDADFSGATWPDGKKCGAGSLGECKKGASGPDNNPRGGLGSRGGSPTGMSF